MYYQNHWKHYQNKNNELIEQITEQTANYEKLLNEKNECIKSIEEYKIQTHESDNNMKQMELQLVNVKEKHNKKIEILNGKQNELIIN